MAQTPRGHGPAHELLENRVGNTPFERAIRLPLERLGRKVTSVQLPSGPPSQKAIAKSIERHEREVARLAQRAKPPRKLLVLRTRAEVLRRMRHVGFLPHATQLAAAFALERGLSKEVLLPSLYAAHLLKERGGPRLYEGSLTDVLTSVNHDLLRRVHDHLHAKPLAQNSTEISRAFGITPNRRNRLRITAALGVLDLMGLTRKLPSPGSKVYRWIHACYERHPATVPRWNVDFRVLNALRHGPRNASDISLPFRFARGQSGGSKRGLATNVSISASFSRLAEAGLVDTTPKGLGRVALLSKYGERLMREQAGLPYLHPELRQALLGLPRPAGQPTHDQLRFIERLRRWARVSRALEQARPLGRKPAAPYAGVQRVVKDLREKLGFVTSVAQGRVPWAGVRRDRLRETYLPLLREKDAEAARLVARRLRL
jgi:hypothetical protein